MTYSRKRSVFETITRSHWFLIVLFAIVGIVSSCAPVTPLPQSANPQNSMMTPSTQYVQLSTPHTPIPSQLPTLMPSPELTHLPQLTATLAPDAWQKMPVIPAVSDTARMIYQRGLERGANTHAFSKIGDCESRTTWFLYDFDQDSKYYDLGPYTYLEPVIEHFQGSFGRLSQVAKPGFTAASVMTPLWADPTQCQKNETPLACEYRQQNPVFSFIMLGTNDVTHPETFETNMRRVIEFTIEQGIVPILATKADNREGEHQINATIARLAYEYDIPLWNFWLAVQDLPNHGLQPDGAHLTWSPNYFGDAEAMKRAWPVRNLTALQTLDAVWRSVTQ